MARILLRACVDSAGRSEPSDLHHHIGVARFGEVIRSIPMEIRLEHFLNDGDSPDIPIPTYVGYLNQIRDLARAQR